MSGKPLPPVIFLAFANDREGKSGYLRNLPEEARQVHAVLDAAAQAGLCEVVMHQNVNVDTVLDVFQDARYRDRIAIFHYGGHAESYELLLETADGKRAAADAGGLATFLSRQRGLQLVFLNGCSTQPQVQGLLDAGIAAVIATAQAIDDTVATDFAVRFYKGLAGGAALQTAFHEAEAACKTTGGGQPRSVYVKKVISTSAERAVADRWPWALTPRPGAELVLQWNLPDAVNDPLFGLPPLPPDDLPAIPFRNILWFRREDAPIFFGRGYDIRELFQRVTAADAAPVVLYYGQSGVGKSSLLAAGLLPRLEQVQTVVYVRRDQALGLVGTLAANLPIVDNPGVSIDSGIVSGADLLAAWRALETATGKPLTVLLDQAEEVYTRPNMAMPGEIGDFLDVLVALFGDPATRPQGRVILGFRKEWLAEIEKLLAERQLPRAKVFLQRLEKRGIVEAVTGPARSERLQQHFGLTVEDDLAGEIADDLLADPSSAVAPTLQILLSKLWDQAKARDYDHPYFDRSLYHDLRRQGLLLGDFLDQQLATLRTAQPAAVDSGLALDLLAFHTTPLGTAEQRTLAELRATYAHQAMTLPDLLAACRDLYLLVDPVENRPDAESMSRLAHDTLAPLVRRRFEESDAPGQRARRILESREANADAIQADPLGEADLAIVETGQSGMRMWRDSEVKLIELSRAERAKRLKRNLLIRSTLIAAVILIGVAAGIAFWQWGVAQQKAAEALDAQATAEVEAENARLALAKAEAQSRRAQAGELAVHAQTVLATNTDPSGSLPLILASEAVLTTWAVDHVVTVHADAVLRDAIDAAPPYSMTLPRRSHTGPVLSTAYSPDGTQIVTASADRTARIWDAATGQELRQLSGHTDYVWSAAYSPDGAQVVTASADQTARIWDAATGQELRQLNGHTDYVNSAAYSSDGTQIVTASADGTARIWDAATGQELHELSGHTANVRSAAYRPDGTQIVTASFDGTARIWDAATGQELPSVSPLSGHTDSVLSAAYSPDGAQIVTTSDDQTARIWDAATGQEIPSVSPLSSHTDSVLSGAYSPDGAQIVTTSDDQTARIWDAATGQEVRQLSGHTTSVWSAAYSPNGMQIVTASADGAVQIWDAATGQELRRLSDHIGEVWSAAYSPDGAQIVTASADGTARIWDAATGQELRRLSGHTDSLNSAAYSPDGTQIITASTDRTARIWDAATGQELRQLSGHTFRVLSAAYSLDGKFIVTASADQTARIWDAATGQELRQLSGHTDSVSSAAYSPDGRKIVTASSDGTARIWDAATGQRLRRLSGHTDSVLSAAYSPDGWKIVTAGDDGTARIWDAATGQELRQLSARSTWLNSAAYSPDGTQIVTASSDGTARIWDAATGQELRQLSGHTDWVYSAAYSPNGAQIVTASSDGTARIWDAATGQEGPGVSTLSGHTAYVWSAAYSPDGRKIVTASADGTVQIWDAATGQRLRRLRVHTNSNSVRSVAYSPDGAQIVTASDDGTARIWDAATGQELRQLSGHTFRVLSAAYSLDGKFIVTASADQTARIWDAATGQELRQLSGHTFSVCSAAYSPDGAQIVTASSDGTARIWDAATGQELRQLSGHTDSVNSAAYSPDGAQIVTASSDGTARIWDVATGQELRQLSGHTDSVNSAAYSPDGAQIVTASADGTARIWDAATGQELRQLSGHTFWVLSAAYSPDGMQIVTASDDRTARIWIANIDDLLAEAAHLIQRNPPILSPEERRRYGLE